MPAPPPNVSAVSWKVRAASPLIGAVMCFLHILGVPVLDRLEHHFYDLSFTVRGSQKPSPDVVLALVDEHSLDSLGRWPWPRSIFATMVDELSRDGAKVIAFTMGFLEPDSADNVALMRQVDAALDRHQVTLAPLRRELQELGRKADTDGLLATAIARSEAAVVLGYFFYLSPDELSVPVPRAELETRRDLIARSAYPLVQMPAGAERPPLLWAFAPQPSLPQLAVATPYAGFLQVPTDPDGSVRRAYLAAEYEGRTYPSFAVQAAWNFLDRPQLALVGSEFGAEGVALGRDHYVETDVASRVLIHFASEPGSYPKYSVADIVERRFPANTFRDKIVLVGSTARGISGQLRTPVDSFMPAVELQATIVDNLITGRARVWRNEYLILDLLAIMAMAMIGGLLLGRRGVVVDVMGVGCLALGYVLGTMDMFQRSGVYVSMTYPPLGLLVTFGAMTILRYVNESARRVQLEGTFGRYVAPRVMTEMLENPEQLRLGGEVRELSVLFSDMKGFTAASESLGPSQMIELMSEYFEEMTVPIQDQDGLLKEYVGDEIMALFGAPLEQPDHAVRACRAALAMRSRLRVLSVAWQEKGRPSIRARWGVNSGEMLVGNIGSSYRFSYGALGDNVNLGSRLEGLNNHYETEILIGENTEALVRDHFHLREVDTVAVKGRTRGVRIFELLAASDKALPPEQVEFGRGYAEALAAYRARDFAAALGHLEGLRQLVPEDGPCRVLAERCRYYQAEPPPEDWGGVFVAKTK